eukprot:GHVU01057415.1.p2 GENE.GHVU01057415.1~~GHVU01057415.1.p2  ORF type:complete len:177 (+),score=24.57 GHVU01057415.1:66-596(+)
METTVIPVTTKTMAETRAMEIKIPETRVMEIKAPGTRVTETEVMRTKAPGNHKEIGPDYVTGAVKRDNMPGIVRHPYPHQIDHRTTNGTTTEEVITAVIKEEKVTVGTMMHEKMVMKTRVNRMTLAGTTDVDEAVAEVEPVVGDQEEVTGTDGTPRRKNLNQKRNPKYLLRFYHSQ